MPTHWDVRREQALSSSLLSEELAEEALAGFEEKLSLRAELDSLTPGTERGPDFEHPSEEEVARIEAVRKSVLSGNFHNLNLRAGPKTFAQSTKLQLSASDGFWDLLNNWACAEGRDVSSVAAVAIEAGLRALKAEGAIPQVAIDAYEKQCLKRFAKAEARGAVASFISDSILPF